MSNDIRDTITWIPCNEGLPKIPEGKHGVPVLVIIYDAVYEEHAPLKGQHVSHCSFHENGKFMVIDGQEWEEYDGHDPITHWSYYPRTPQKILAPQAMW